MSSLQANSLKKQYGEFKQQFNDMPAWVKLGSFGIMLVGPNIDPTIAAADKVTITNITLGIGAAILIKKADTHRCGRSASIVEQKTLENAANRLENQSE